MRHFFGQRIRQAYDEFARPHRLAIALLLVPVVARTRLRGAIAIAAGSVAVAEIGRRRSGGRSAFPPTSALWAPAWVAERAVTSWLAVGSRLLSGGIRYRGTVLRRAATPHRHRPTPATARSDRAPLRPDG